MKKAIIIVIVILALIVIAYLVWNKYGTKVEDTVISDSSNTSYILSTLTTQTLDNPNR